MKKKKAKNNAGMRVTQVSKIIIFRGDLNGGFSEKYQLIF